MVTDWGGSNDHIRSIALRSNLEMPTPGLDAARRVIKVIEDGELTMEELNQCVDDLLSAVLELSGERNIGSTINWEAHHQLARKAAEESIVLLKNEGGAEPLLPLKKGCRVALIGDFAFTPRYQGTGSSVVNTQREVETMRNLIEGYPVELVGCCPGYHRSDASDETLKKEAIELAQNAETVLYCFGLNESSEAEGMDRGHMRIPQNQLELLESLASVNSNIVGVMRGGSVVEMTSWRHLCKALFMDIWADRREQDQCYVCLQEW